MLHFTGHISCHFMYIVTNKVCLFSSSRNKQALRLDGKVQKVNIKYNLWDWYIKGWTD